MATEAELQAENARLRDELRAARQAPQAGAVDLPNEYLGRRAIERKYSHSTW
jgi:hypothetical protein